MAHRSKIDPATRTFMALRIAVNQELGALERLLESLPSLLGGGAKVGESSGGRAAIISFHSLEDRLVKHSFADLHRRGLVTRLTRKPRVADEAERRDNPRSRSAKLRAIRWTGSV
jgi:16S rRNA (cytosine1402-N4)-methyltransferase